MECIFVAFQSKMTLAALKWILMPTKFSGLRASCKGWGGGGEGAGHHGPQRWPPHERQRHLLRPGNQDGHPPDPQGVQLSKLHLIRFLTTSLSGHQIRRSSSRQKLYENMLDLVLGTLYITSYFNHQHQLLEFQGAPLQTLVAPSRQFSCQHWLSSPTTFLALRKL